MVEKLIENVRRNKVTDGMIAAVQRCSEILLENGFKRTKDDVNELRDDLRLED